LKQLIIESGGTKSSWFVLNQQKIDQQFTIDGMHPLEVDVNPIKKELFKKTVQSLEIEKNSQIYFYGAGCEHSKGRDIISAMFLAEGFRNVHVYSDLHGACVAILAHRSGCIGILGTGAVAASFNGTKITQQTSGLGYILGDEGSGFDIGKKVLVAYFNQTLSHELALKIEDSFHGHSEILSTVHSPIGRKKVAALCEIIFPYKETEEIQFILKKAFEDYYVSAILPLSKCNDEISFVGSIAYYYSTELRAVLNKHGIDVPMIIKSAGSALANYHLNKN
jgi:N-acetylglucosamine kinase-like BadF-type ATPase